ncbi:Nucleolar protein 9 [Irineochytrium annulatum]|nr:Nucleolar protein 9 [Irineochytrium annulatum]
MLEAMERLARTLASTGDQPGAGVVDPGSVTVPSSVVAAAKSKKRGKRGGVKARKEAGLQDTPSMALNVAVEVSQEERPSGTSSAARKVATPAKTSPLTEATTHETVKKNVSQQSNVGASSSSKPSTNGKVTKRGKRGGVKKPRPAGPEPASGPELGSTGGVVAAGYDDDVARGRNDLGHANAKPVTKRGKRGGVKKPRPGMEPVQNAQEDYLEQEAVGLEDEEEPWKEEEASAPKKGGRFSTRDMEQPDFGRVEPDTLQYFENVEKKLDESPEEAWEDDEDRTMFVTNVYEEVRHHTLKLAGDDQCSRILEKLLRISTDVQIRRLVTVLEGMFADMFRHRFASHVVQTLLVLAADIIDREIANGVAPDDADPPPEKPLPSMQDLFAALCDELKGQHVGLMSDPWASHLLRTLLQILSGQALLKPEEVDKQRSKRSRSYNKKNNNQAAAQTRAAKQAALASATKRIPTSFAALLEGIVDSILASLQEYEIREYAVHPVASPVLQLLVAVKSGGRGQRLIDAMLEIDAEEEALRESRSSFMDRLIRDQVGSHLVEKVVEHASAEQFHALYVTYFRGRLRELCDHRAGNFAVQAVLAHLRNAVQLEVVMTEILGFAEVLVAGKTNRSHVLVKLLEGCRRLKAGQKEAVRGLWRAFGVKEPNERKWLILLMLHKVPWREFRSDMHYAYDYQGALMLEHVLHFDAEHAKEIVDGFMSLPTTTTHPWCYDPVASRVFENILTLPSVPLKCKKKIMHDLEGKYADMACDKFGSFVVDRCWAAADVDMKGRIVGDLVKNESRLEGSYFGRIVHAKCRVSAWKAGKQAWEERENGLVRKRDMFKEFMDDGGAGAEKRAGEDGGVTIGDALPAEEVDPLWSTTLYDEAMATLGFGRGKGLKKKEAVEKEKNGAETKGKVMLVKRDRKPDKGVDKLKVDDDDEDEEAGDAMEVEDDHEIDDLFKKGKKRKMTVASKQVNADDADEDMEQPPTEPEPVVVTKVKASKKRAQTVESDGESDNSDDSDDDAAAKKSTKKKGQVDAGLEDVLNALANTKRKKKKKKVDDDEVDGTTSADVAVKKKKKVQKKRKFES